MRSPAQMPAWRQASDTAAMKSASERFMPVFSFDDYVVSTPSLSRRGRCSTIGQEPHSWMRLMRDRGLRRRHESDLRLLDDGPGRRKLPDNRDVRGEQVVTSST